MTICRWSRLRNELALLSATCALAFVTGGRMALADERDREFEIGTLSTRADMVSGDDVLVQVNVPSNVRLADVRVRPQWARRDQRVPPRCDRGVACRSGGGSGLGWNTLAVSSTGRGRAGAPTARLALVNHPITGPIFSGPQQTPFICETQTFVLQ